MKIFQSNPVRLILLALFIVSCTPEDDGIYFEKIQDTKIKYSEIEIEILQMINNHRESKNLYPLERMNYISSVAQTHTDYMVETGLVNHDNFPQRNEQLVVNAQAKKVGENVAYGYSTALGVVNAWLNSDSHRAIIENENYTHFGISTEKNESGRYFYTQMFIQK
jgi:uncharacterized protein YkwD